MASSPNTRSPRGTKPVAQAFFAAADEIPEASRPAVIKAALAMIRDQLKADREKIAAAKAKAKGKAAAPAKRATAKKSAAGKAAPKMAPKAASSKKAAAKAPARAPAKAKARKTPAKRARKAAAESSLMPIDQQEEWTAEADVASPEEDTED